MFLVYIDGFMSSNPSWHQPNPRYQQHQQQQQGVPPHVYGTNNKNKGRHPHGTNPTPGTNNNNKGTHPAFMVPTTRIPPPPWHQPNPRYQQQQHGVPPPLIFMVPTTKIRGVTPSAYGLWAAPLHFMVPTSGDTHPNPNPNIE